MLSLLKIKRALRNGPYTWPGGYPLYFITEDGCALSFASVRSNWREVVSDHLQHCPCHRGGWALAAVETNWEDAELTCDHSGERIESAYAE